VSGDNPIRRLEDDALGRTAIARSFAKQVLALDASEGLVVGILGPWGSGKTSFINLARAQLDREGVPILDFNPWMFSGAQQLVDSFFIELAAQLKIRPGLAEVGKDLEEYGETFSGMAWLPIVGPWLERAQGAAKILGKVLQRRKEGVGERRAKLSKALAELTKPVVVVLDDIDRLSTSEIRDVFKLVRLTASFPNIIYFVAFDRARVEDALAEQRIPGRDYLEKILQVAFDLPVIPHQVLNQQIFSALDSALADFETSGSLDEDVWPDVFMEIIRPLIRNMRDVRRYAAAVHGTVGVLDGRVALADVLGLEAVRVFLPDVFARLNGAVEALTITDDRPHGVLSDASRLKAQIDDLIEAAGPQADVVRCMIRRLFLAGQRHVGGIHHGGEWKKEWLRERRVAHEDFLRFYLERIVGESLQAFTDAEQAWGRMADRVAFEDYLRSLDPRRLEDVITSLEAFEDRFAPEHVVPGAIVLLNLLPEIPERPRGMFEFGSRLAVTRVTYRLLRSLSNADEVEVAVRSMLPELKSLSAKLELISEVGHREHRGHKLVSEAAAAEFETEWRADVRGSSADRLAEEVDLFRVLLVAKREADSTESKLEIHDAPHLTRAVLRTARSEVISHISGRRRVSRSPRLSWDVLIELYGDEETLKKRIEAIAETGDEEGDDLLELANKYLGGWRPSDFGDE